MSTAPAASQLDPVQQDVVRAVVERHRNRRGPLLEILHEVQERIGYVPPAVVPLIATELNVSRADVHGVLTFYHHFRTTPPGARVLRVCRAESCQAMHGRAVEAHARRRLGIDFGETTGDGAVSLEAVYCLGLCAMSPAVMIDGEVHGRVSPERLDELLAGHSKGGPA
jgi:formate dehydrogenase subunit gamma